MRFYNREKELASLEKVRGVSFSVHSQMTVLTGRRRIGKTSLIFKSCEMKRLSVYDLFLKSGKR